MGNHIYRSMVFQPPYPSYTTTRPRKVIWINIPKLNKRIPAYFIRARKAGVRTTILYSHGNASDIGEMTEFLQMLHENLDVNLFHYDYIGYGLARNEDDPTCYPTETNVYQAVEAGLDFLLNKKGLEMHDIIAMGTSVGSGPTTHLVSKYRRLRGFILECPFASCIRVIMKHQVVNIMKPVDMFVNIKKVEKLKCKMLLFHGTDDTVISFSNSEMLWEKVPTDRKHKFVQVKGADHNDIIFKLGPDEFLKEIKIFLDECDKDIKIRMGNHREFRQLEKEEKGSNFVERDPSVKFTEYDEEEADDLEDKGDFYDIYKYLR